MSVLSRPTLHRPTLHRATAPTQREAQVPLQRTPSAGEKTVSTQPQITQPAPQPDRRTRTTMIVGGGLVVALAIGVGAYTLLEDDGRSSTVIAPAVTNVPDFADLGRDAAAARRAADAAAAAGVTTSTDTTVVTEAERQAALAQRLNNSGGDAAAFTSGSTAESDASRLTEAQRDAALARRAQNTQQ